MRLASQKVRLRLLPGFRSSFDEPLQVKVDGLHPHQRVMLKSRLTDHRGAVFRGSSLHTADAHGQVDVSTSPSLGGSYTGVEPMGLFWSVAPDALHTKFSVKSALSPVVVDVGVHSWDSGQVLGPPDHSWDSGQLLASDTNHRHFMAEGVRRIPLKQDRIRGVLFLPSGDYYECPCPDCQMGTWVESRY